MRGSVRVLCIYSVYGSFYFTFIRMGIYSSTIIMKKFTNTTMRSVLLASVIPGLMSQLVQAQGADSYSLVEKESKKSIVVKVIEIQGDEIHFRYKGKSFKLPLARFKDGTAKEVEELLTAKKEEGGLKSERINEGVGHSLFGSSSLWEEKASDVAKRLI